MTLISTDQDLMAILTDSDNIMSELFVTEGAININTIFLVY